MLRASARPRSARLLRVRRLRLFLKLKAGFTHEPLLVTELTTQCDAATDCAVEASAAAEKAAAAAVADKGTTMIKKAEPDVEQPEWEAGAPAPGLGPSDVDEGSGGTPAPPHVCRPLGDKWATLTLPTLPRTLRP